MKSKYIFILSVLYLVSFSQENPKVLIRSYVKKDVILFRLLPVNSNGIQDFHQNGLSIIRSEFDKGLSKNDTLLIKSLMPYNKNDVTKWMQIIKKNKGKGAFAYQSLYNNVEDPKNNDPVKKKQDKMINDMLLLSCDFDSDIAKACGLYFQDTSFKDGQTYQYKIILNTSQGKQQTIATTSLNTAVLSTNPEITTLTGKAKNGVASINWNAFDHKNFYSGYNIERSQDSSSFVKINNASVVLLTTSDEAKKKFIFYTDTMPEIHKRYYYRIKGINFFGEESQPSNLTSVYSTPVIKSTPLLDIQVIRNREVKLKWRMSDVADNPSVKKFVLLKSEFENRDYYPAYCGMNLEYLDTSLKKTNYYKIGAVTYNDDTLSSYSGNAVIIDTIPPLIPTGITAEVNSSGFVTIRWKGNRETDLQGYKLYRSNSTSDEFVQMNSKFIKDTFYNEKLNLKTLSRNVFYKISSCDNNFNTSERSPAVKINRPDTISPVSPVLISAVPCLQGVSLKFILSKSEDVCEHEIHRRYENEKLFTPVMKIKSDTISWLVDATINLGERVYYILTAKDSASNKSCSNTVMLIYENGFRKKITDWQYIVDRSDKSIRLSWECKEKGIEKFIIYRNLLSDQIRILKTVEADAFNYTDRTMHIGNEYEYRIKAVLENGAETRISEPLKITY